MTLHLQIFEHLVKNTDNVMGTSGDAQEHPVALVKKCKTVSTAFDNHVNVRLDISNCEFKNKKIKKMSLLLG